jgi:hypothetical protein
VVFGSATGKVAGSAATGLAAIVLVAAATAPSAEARQGTRAKTGCTPRVAFSAVEKLFAAINAGSAQRTLAAMTPPTKAGGPWFLA